MEIFCAPSKNGKSTPEIFTSQKKEVEDVEKNKKLKTPNAMRGFICKNSLMICFHTETIFRKKNRKRFKRKQIYIIVLKSAQKKFPCRSQLISFGIKMYAIFILLACFSSSSLSYKFLLYFPPFLLLFFIIAFQQNNLERRAQQRHKDDDSIRKDARTFLFSR